MRGVNAKKIRKEARKIAIRLSKNEALLHKQPFLKRCGIAFRIVLGTRR